MTSHSNGSEQENGRERKNQPGCRRRLAVAAVVFLILLGLIIAAGLWRISRGPVSLAFLEPRLVWSLDDDPEALTLAIRNPAITWGGWHRPVDLRAGPVVISDHEDRAVLEIEDISVGLAWLELFKKRVALTRIEVRSIHLQLLRTADGRIVPGFEATSRKAPAKQSAETESALAAKIHDALTSPEPVPPFDHLTEFSVLQSMATLDDRVLGVTWKVPKLDLTLRRQSAELRIAADATLDVESYHTDLKIDGSLDRDNQRLKATISVSDLHPDSIGHLIPALDPLTQVKSPVDLEVSGDFSLDGTIHSADVDLESHFGQVKGTVRRTDAGGFSAQATLTEVRVSEFADLLPQLAVLDQPVNGTVSAVLSPEFRLVSAESGIQTEMGQAEGSLDVDAAGTATVQATVTGFQPWKLEDLVPDLSRIQLPIDLQTTVELTPEHTVDRATAQVTCGPGTVDIPEIHHVPYQIKGATLEASATEALNSLEISNVTVDLAELRVHATGTATRGENTTQITSSATLSDFSVATIDQYWPSALVPDVLGWIAANITAGEVQDAAVHVALSLPSDSSRGLRLSDLRGSFGLNDLSVTYLSPMPPATGLSGTARFTAEGFDITVNGGGIEDLSITSAKVGIGPLSGTTRLTIETKGIRGPVSTATRVLAGPPLELIGAGLPQPDQFSGTADTHLVLDIPLSVGDPKPLRVSGSSKLEGVGVTGWVKGYDLSDGALDLGFDLSKLDVTGTASVNGVEASFSWHEDLSGGSTPRTINARTTLDDGGLEALGLPTIGQLHGPIDVTLDLTGRRDGSMDIALDGDLLQTDVAVAPLGWNKPPGSACGLSVQSVLSADRSLTVDRFEVEADDFNATGHLATGPGLSPLKALVLDRLESGRSHFRGSLAVADSGRWGIQISGGRFDIRPILEAVHTKRDDSASPRPESNQRLPQLDIDVRFREVVDGPDHTLGRVAASASSDGTTWNRIDGELAITEDNIFRVQFGPGAQAGHDLRMTAHNAGEVLSTLLPRSEVIGGALEITGHRSSRDGPLSGHFRLDDFVVSESDTLTRIVQLASIGGAVDALSGTGLQFKRLDADYVLADKILTIDGFRTNGSSLGITSDGDIDFNHSTLNLTGAVVPASRIQSLLGKIPGVGVILTGTKKEGLLAVNYSVTGSASAPDVSVKPLSGLTPGILRDMFRIPEEVE